MLEDNNFGTLLFEMHFYLSRVLVFGLFRRVNKII